jgi:hypothetical protein
MSVWLLSLCSPVSCMRPPDPRIAHRTKRAKKRSSTIRGLSSPSPVTSTFGNVFHHYDLTHSIPSSQRSGDNYFAEAETRRLHRHTKRKERKERLEDVDWVKPPRDKAQSCEYLASTRPGNGSSSENPLHEVALSFVYRGKCPENNSERPER